VVLGLIVLGTGFKVLKLCESRDVLAVFKTDHCQKKNKLEHLGKVKRKMSFTFHM